MGCAAPIFAKIYIPITISFIFFSFLVFYSLNLLNGCFFPFFFGIELNSLLLLPLILVWYHALHLIISDLQQPHQWLQKCVKCKKFSILHILTQKTPTSVFVKMCKYTPWLCK